MSDATTPTEVVTDIRFAMIPEWILDHPDLTDAAVRCYGVLARYADNDRALWPSQETIAERMRKSVATVERLFSELKKAGALVVKTRRRNSSTVWLLRLLPPASYPQDPQNPRSDGPLKNEGSQSGPLKNDGPGPLKNEGQTRTRNQNHSLGAKAVEKRGAQSGIPEGPRQSERIKYDQIRNGNGCEPCDGLGVIEQRDATWSQCRSCLGAGWVDPSEQVPDLRALVAS